MALLDNRRRGFHPLRIDLLFGDDWREASTRMRLEKAMLVRDGARAAVYGEAWLRAIGHPMLAVRPREYTPGALDLSCLVATHVHVVDGCGSLGDYDVDGQDKVTRWGLVYHLIGEASVWAGRVTFSDSWHSADELDVKEAEAYADAMRWETPLDDGKIAWPAWWPVDDITKANRERRKRAYTTDYLNDSARAAGIA
jgi:hypothetical protein